MKKPLTLEEYHEIYSKVTRLTVEVIVRSNEGILLTKRAIEPDIGKWHLPGGSVLFGETVEEAVKRVAKEELNVEIEINKFIDFIYYPKTSEEHNVWPVGAAYLAKILVGEIKLDHQASDWEFFTKIPENTVEDQKNFLIKHYN